MTETGQLPQSDALAAARADTLSELCSRDPATYTEADIDRMVGELRKQRDRIEEMERTGRKAGAKKEIGPAVAAGSADDFM